MKNALAIICVAVLAGSLSYAKDKNPKTDWKICQTEIHEYCTAAVDDVEKHECLEEISKNKLSKLCKEFNEALAAQLGHKHRAEEPR